MSSTTTKQDAKVGEVRKNLVQTILSTLAGVRDLYIKVGVSLTELKGTFSDSDKGTEAFLAYCERHVGLKKAAVYRYMQAANVAARVPEILNVTTAIAPVASLDRLPTPTIEKVAKKAKKGATQEDLAAIAAEVDQDEADRQAKREAAKAKRDAQKDGDLDLQMISIARKITGRSGKAEDQYVERLVETANATKAEDLSAALRPIVQMILRTGMTYGGNYGPLTAKAYTYAVKGRKVADETPAK